MYSVGDSGNIYFYDDPSSVDRAWRNGDYSAVYSIDFEQSFQRVEQSFQF